MATSGQTTRPGIAADERYWRNALLCVFAVTILRLSWMGTGQTDLYPDEAQYWFWSLHPAFGYYSKPPVVAWLIALTTRTFGSDELGVRLAAPLLHFGTALVTYALARRLYDARIAAWSAATYITLPGVSVSAIIMSTDAPLLFFWAIALYALVRAREPGGQTWWLVVGVAAGFGLLSKYAMAYWLLEALLYLLLFRDERRHLKYFLGASLLALVIYSPNFLWNLNHGFVSYHHTEDNASLNGPLFHPSRFLEFFGAQFGVFGPLLFTALIAIVALGRRVLSDRRAAFLACFALPSLVMMLGVSFLSRAQANWSVPSYVSATVLVVAWLFAIGWRRIVLASVVLHVVVVTSLLELRPAAQALGYDLPMKYDPLHRLRGWRRLGLSVSHLLLEHPGMHLLADDREDMAALLYYVEPPPIDPLKWNGDDEKIHDGFDLTADPQRLIGQDFLLVSHSPDNIDRIVSRFASAGAVGHIFISLGGGEGRTYVVRELYGFKGYR
jgi:Dolichyl-phosphate-mannose-protein mannosyltransferase